jgi:hypothetical protein
MRWLASFSFAVQQMPRQRGNAPGPARERRFQMQKQLTAETLESVLIELLQALGRAGSLIDVNIAAGTALNAVSGLDQDD